MNGLFEAPRTIEWWQPTYETTVQECFRLARTYAADVDEYNFRDFVDAYAYVRDLPFIENPPGVQLVTRPAFCLSPRWRLNRVCVDKTTALGAFAERRRIKYRWAVVGEDLDNSKNPHHIYPEFFIEGQWIPMDATYPEHCRMGERLYEERFRRIFGRPG